MLKGELMRSKSQWFGEYSKSHQNQMNIKIHKICVPLIAYSLIGMIWLIPSPSLYPASMPPLWGSLFLLLAMFFYLTWKDAKVMMRMVVFFLLPNLVLWEVMRANAPHMILVICLPVFIASWIGQFIGHKIEGKKPSFFEDLLFLLVGPAWVFEH